MQGKGLCFDCYRCLNEEIGHDYNRTGIISVFFLNNTYFRSVYFYTCNVFWFIAISRGNRCLPRVFEITPGVWNLNHTLYEASMQHQLCWLYNPASIELDKLHGMFGPRQTTSLIMLFMRLVDKYKIWEFIPDITWEIQHSWSDHRKGAS